MKINPFKPLAPGSGLYEGNYFRIGLGRDNFKGILLELEGYLAKL